jgi:hypothetical protein
MRSSLPCSRCLNMCLNIFNRKCKPTTLHSISVVGCPARCEATRIKHEETIYRGYDLRSSGEASIWKYAQLTDISRTLRAYSSSENLKDTITQSPSSLFFHRSFLYSFIWYQHRSAVRSASSSPICHTYQHLSEIANGRRIYPPTSPPHLHPQ